MAVTIKAQVILFFFFGQKAQVIQSHILNMVSEYTGQLMLESDKVPGKHVINQI